MGVKSRNQSGDYIAGGATSNGTTTVNLLGNPTQTGAGTTGLVAYPFDRPGQISKIWHSVQVAAVGAATKVTFDFLKNGTSIWTTKPFFTFATGTVKTVYEFGVLPVRAAPVGWSAGVATSNQLWATGGGLLVVPGDCLAMTIVLDGADATTKGVVTGGFYVDAYPGP